MIDWSRAAVLTATEFDVARDLCDLGAGPAVLDLVSPGPTDVERARVVRGAIGSLAARGWFADGRFAPALVDDLRTVLGAEFQHDLVVMPPAPQRALVGHRGGRAVLATRISDDVALLRIRPEDAAAVLVELLGPVVAGPGPTARIPATVLADAAGAAGGDPDRLVPELLRRGCTGAEADLVRRMGGIDGIAQLGAGRRGPGARRAPGVLLLHATPQGCFRQLRPTPGTLGGGLPDDATVRVGPADAPLLVAELERLASAVAPRRAGALSR